MLGFLFTIIGGLFFLGHIICFILILIKMFQREDSTLAIICIVTAICFIGTVVAFVVGWVKNAQYDANPTMLAWTVCLIGMFVASGLSAIL